MTDADLRRFVRDQVSRGFYPQPCSVGSFAGIVILPPTNSTDHTHWWLRHERLILSITSLGNVPDAASEQILHTLLPRECA